MVAKVAFQHTQPVSSPTSLSHAPSLPPSLPHRLERSRKFVYLRVPSERSRPRTAQWPAADSRRQHAVMQLDDPLTSMEVQLCQGTYVEYATWSSIYHCVYNMY